MKNIVIIAITLMVFSCGTDQGEAKKYIYTLVNQSEESIKIKAFNSSNPQLLPEIINLGLEEELTKTFQDNLPPRGYDFVEFFQGDSLEILYNNEKRQIFKFNGASSNDRNPFYHHGTEITFIFTVQDYQNAEDCNGNCE